MEIPPTMCQPKCHDVKGIQSTLMRTFTTLRVVALLVVMLALMACGGGNQELPDIEGTAGSIIPESRAKSMKEVRAQAIATQSPTMPPISTPVLPTATVVPSTTTEVPPTVTPTQRPLTSIPVSPTATSVPSTATLVSPTATPVPPTPTSVTYTSDKHGFSITHPSSLLADLDEDTEYSASGEKGWLYIFIGPDRGSSDIEKYGDATRWDSVEHKIISRKVVSPNKYCPCYRIDYENEVNEKTYRGAWLFMLSSPKVIKIGLASYPKDWDYFENLTKDVFSSVTIKPSPFPTSTATPRPTSTAQPSLSAANAATPNPKVPSTATPVPDAGIIIEFQPLEKPEAREILAEIFWNGLKVLGSTKTSVKPNGDLEVVAVTYEQEVINLFETAFYLLTGNSAPLNLRAGLYYEEDYESLTLQHGVSPEYVAWCCIEREGDLEMVVNAERRFPKILQSIAHESGHAMHWIENPISTGYGKGEIRALKEAVAFAYEAAITRKLGEYTDLNATRFPQAYPSVLNFNNNWVLWRDNIGDVNEPHFRGYALLWLMLFHDSELVELKKELDSNYVLSPESLLVVANKLISMNTVPAADYVSEILTKEKLFEAKTFIKGKITARNSTEPLDGLLKEDIGILLTP